MINNDKTKKTIWIFLAVDIVLALIYGGLFFAVRQKNAETSLAHSSVYRQASDENAFTRLEKNIADTEKQRTLLDDHIITSSETLLFIEQIEDLGKKTFANVHVVSLSNPKKAGDPFSLDFTAEGKFENVYRLFSLIEEMPFRLSLKMVNMTANAQEMKWNGSFTVTLDSYRL